MDAQTKFIVWDWNGTLFDDVDAVLSCYNLILADVSRGPIDLASFREWHDLPFEKIYRRAGVTETELAQVLKAKERDAFHDSYEPLADTLGLRTGAVEILSRIREGNAHSLILSNHIADKIHTQLERLKIGHYFHEILAYPSRAEQFRETKGERLRRFIGANVMRPENTMIVGDTMEEIEIARTLGLISVAITGGCVSETRLRAAKPDHLVHSLHELEPILQERGFAS